MWNAFLIVKPIGMTHLPDLLLCKIFGIRIKSRFFPLVKLTPFIVQPMLANPLANKSLFKPSFRAFKDKRPIINSISL